MAEAGQPDLNSHSSRSVLVYLRIILEVATMWSTKLPKDCAQLWESQGVPVFNLLTVHSEIVHVAICWRPSYRGE